MSVDARRFAVAGSGSKARLANHAWESILSVHAVFMRRFAATDVWQGMSMRDYDVLYTLSKCGAPVRQSELERHVLLSQPAISRLVDRLLDRGLVMKEADPADRRSVLLSLTDAGRTLQRQVGGRHAVDVARAMGSELSREELAAIVELMGKLVAGAANAGSNEKGRV